MGKPEPEEWLHRDILYPESAGESRRTNGAHGPDIMNAILWIYNLLFPLALLLAAPWWLLRMLTTARYREGMMQRMGWVPARFHLPADVRPVIWVHAVSVGEILAALKLIQQLDVALPEMRIVVSTTTRTGQQLALARLGAERVFYCPLDLAWSTRAWLQALQPRMLVLMETEFWPGILGACFRRNIPVVVANARISDRSWPRYQRLRKLWQPFLRRLRFVWAQSDLDAERLRALGCRQAQAIGNLKYDLSVERDAAIVHCLRWLAPQLRWLVAGSTLDGEEQLLLNAWKQLAQTHSDIALLLAPRHPERFAVVGRLLNSSGIRWRKRSEIAADSEAIQPGEIVLLDTIGELASAYSLATAAFVGGSLLPSGGHNPLEAAFHAVPVVMGSYCENFRAIVDELRKENAIVIPDANSDEELCRCLEKLFVDAEFARATGQRARQVLNRHSGATARTVAMLCAELRSKQEASS